MEIGGSGRGIAVDDTAPPGRWQPAGAAVAVLLVLLLGRIAGLLRDLIIAPLFGAGVEVDALVAARTVPELVLALVTAGAITAGFLPAMSYLCQGREHLPAEGVKTISVVANWLVLLTVLLSLVGMLYPERMVDVVTPGLDAERRELAASLLRVILPVTSLVTAAAVLATWLNFRRRFALPAARALVTNLAIIVLTLVLAGPLGIYSVALGWLVGAFLQVVLLIPAARGGGVQYRWSLDLGAQRLLPVLGIIAPIVLAQLLLYGRTLVERQFGSWLPAGDLAYLNYAYRIGTAPMMIVTNAIITVYMPLFSQRAASGDGAGLFPAVGQSLRLMLLGIMPFVILFATLPQATIQVLMEHGAFTPSDTAITARLLLWYTLALVAASFTMVLSQVLYAQRRGPFALAAVGGGLVVQVGITALLLSAWGASAVAAGTALGFVASALILAVPLLPAARAAGGRGLRHHLSILLPAVVMLASTLAVHRLTRALALPPAACYALSLGLGGGLYALASWWLGIPEVKRLGQHLAARVRRGSAGR